MGKNNLYKQTSFHNSSNDNTQESKHNVEEEKSYIYLRHAKALWSLNYEKQIRTIYQS